MARQKTTRGGGAGAGPPEEELDALYALPLEEFTSAKKALARRLREQGNDPAADAVNELPKPNLAMWAVNQLARSHRQDVRALLDSGERLREAQRAALRGEGAEALREGTRTQRGLVLVLTEDAAAILSQAGKAATQTTRDQIRATLTAAANGPPGERALLERGRLSRPLEPTSFGDLVEVRLPAVEPRRGAEEHARVEERARAEEQRAAEARGRALEAERRAAGAAKPGRAERDRAEDERRRAEAERERAEAERRAREARQAAEEAGRQRAAEERRRRKELERQRREATDLLRRATAAEREAGLLEARARKAEEAAAKARARAEEARSRAAAIRDEATRAGSRVRELAP